MTIAGEFIDTIRGVYIVYKIFSAEAPQEQLTKGIDALEEVADLLNQRAIPYSVEPEVVKRVEDLRSLQQTLEQQSYKKTQITAALRHLRQTHGFSKKADKLRVKAVRSSKGYKIDMSAQAARMRAESRDSGSASANGFKPDEGSSSGWISNEADAVDLDLDTSDVTMNWPSSEPLDAESILSQVMKGLSLGPEVDI